MPSLTRKPKPDPKLTYTAVESAITPGGEILRGRRYRGDEAVVRSMFAAGYFVPGYPTAAELDAATFALRGRVQSAVPAEKPDGRFRVSRGVPSERRMVATRSLIAPGGRGMFLVEAGQIADRDHPIVRAHPEAFAPAQPDVAS